MGYVKSVLYSLILAGEIAAVMWLLDYRLVAAAEKAIENKMEYYRFLHNKEVIEALKPKKL